jgi:hypothetical protein
VFCALRERESLVAESLALPPLSKEAQKLAGKGRQNSMRQGAADERSGYDGQFSS